MYDVCLSISPHAMRSIHFFLDEMWKYPPCIFSSCEWDPLLSTYEIFPHGLLLRFPFFMISERRNTILKTYNASRLAKKRFIFFLIRAKFGLMKSMILAEPYFVQSLRRKIEIFMINNDICIFQNLPHRGTKPLNLPSAIMRFIILVSFCFLLKTQCPGG